MINRRINIYRANNTITAGFAADELQKYLKKIMADFSPVIETSEGKYNPEVSDGIWIGTTSNFDLPNEIVADDPEMDDGYYIEVIDGKGIIAGINARSILLGVYRFLTEIGCRWIRPGEDGEYIAKRNVFDAKVRIVEKPSYRHRGICIEGAVSIQNVADMIDWAPKLGFNSYFLQFRESFTFFDRWYGHRNNPTKEPEKFVLDDAKAIVKKLAKEIKKRGMLYHAVGHGWTCEPLGIPGTGWDAGEYSLTPELEKYLAEVDGKRNIWKGIPVNTNLCYSNPEVRKLIINDVMKYLEQNKDIAILHLWLADEPNNHCECEECRKKIPSDYYVILLNELDEALTEKGNPAKIVFLIYLDLLWCPQTEKLRNPDRFLLMFAPISRTYSEPFTAKGTVPELPEYKRNRLDFSGSIEMNVEFLRSWQRLFKGDGFDFDYHFIWSHYYDIGYCKIAHTLYNDIKLLTDLGLNGLMSCQMQRAFFPTGLGMYVMGKTLWNSQADYEQIATEFFTAAFGEDGKECRRYLEELSMLSDIKYTESNKLEINRDAAEKYYSVKEYIAKFRPVIERNLYLENDCLRQSWCYLKLHAQFADFYAEMLGDKALGKDEAAKMKWNALKRFIQINEDSIQRVFDVYHFIDTIDKKIN